MKKKTLGAATLAALLTLTACGGDDQAEAETEPSQPPPENTVDPIFDGHNSVALMYRWVKPEGDSLGIELSGWYTYHVGTPQPDGEVETTELYHGRTLGDEVNFPPSSVRDFEVSYISVPDGDRVWSSGRVDDVSAPDGATLECLIVSLDGEGVLAHEESDYFSDPVICEVAF